MFFSSNDGISKQRAVRDARLNSSVVIFERYMFIKSIYRNDYEFFTPSTLNDLST